MKSCGIFFLLQNVIAVATYLAKEKYISQWKQQLRTQRFSGGDLVDFGVRLIQWHRNT